MSDQQAGEATPLPIIRKNFTVVWLSGDDRSQYRFITGSGLMPENPRMLILFNDVETEFWLNLDSIASIVVSLERGDE